MTRLPTAARSSPNAAARQGKQEARAPGGHRHRAEPDSADPRRRRHRHRVAYWLVVLGNIAGLDWLIGAAAAVGGVLLAPIFWAHGVTPRGLSLDGGSTWQLVTFPDVTVCTGGEFDRASDPWVSFGPDGTVCAMHLVTAATPSLDSRAGSAAMA